MNIVLFEPAEIATPLPLADPRATHILKVLRRNKGDMFDAGQVNGPRGKATVIDISDSTLALAFQWHDTPPPSPPLSLIIGLTRPQTARKILQETVALGVDSLHFVATERGEPSYADSTLWTTGEWRRHLVTGAAQAFCTRIPAVTWNQTLPQLLNNLSKETKRIALDNYEASADLASAIKADSQCDSVTIAIGSERGWTANERELLRKNNFALAHLGSRVLRTETAAVAAVAIVRSTMGWF